MKTITFRLTSVQPLLLTSLQGDPNSSVSFPYIPGSVLRGALIGQYCQGKELDLEEPQIRRWFFDGTTRYLNAYLLIDGMRAVPTPRTFAIEKTDEWDQDKLKIYDLGIETPDESLRSLSGFLARDQRDNLLHASTQMVVNIHNQRDRPRGRGIEGAGAVFRYEAIAPEQTFIAAIICDDADVVPLKQLIPNHLWLGGSRSAGYGEVRIDDINVVDDWNELAPISPSDTWDDDEDAVEPPLPDPLRLTMLLTSDMLLRSASGSYSTKPPDKQIAALLGVNITFDKARSSLGTTPHGGFNRTWGLPLPQTPALAAGSVLIYTCSTPPSTDGLAKLATEGLGERRAEGFGRIVCNVLPVSNTHTLHRWLPEDHADIQTPALDEHAHTLASVMARRIVEQRLETRLIEQTQKHQIKQTISNTQLSRLHIIARRALGSGTTGEIQQFLDTLPANAREQFARARVGNQSLDAWIKEHLEPISTDWDANVLQIAVADVTLEPDSKMKTDFTLRLLMAMTRLKVRGDERD